MYRHRAATTNSAAFVNLLLNPPESLKLPKTRLNTADRIGACNAIARIERSEAYDPTGNTPLHLAMESGHGDVAVILIEAGADRSRVRRPVVLVYSIWSC